MKEKETKANREAAREAVDDLRRQVGNDVFNSFGEFLEAFNDVRKKYGEEGLKETYEGVMIRAAEMLSIASKKQNEG